MFKVLAAAFTALAFSVFGLRRLKMTGFAWTTAVLATASYTSLSLCFNWLRKKAEIQALWCLPLAAMETVALLLERRGRVRWTLPFHLVALLALLLGLAESPFCFARRGGGISLRGCFVRALTCMKAK